MNKSILNTVRTRVKQHYQQLIEQAQAKRCDLLPEHHTLLKRYDDLRSEINRLTIESNQVMSLLYRDGVQDLLGKPHRIMSDRYSEQQRLKLEGFNLLTKIDDFKFKLEIEAVTNTDLKSFVEDIVKVLPEVKQLTTGTGR